MRCIVCSKDFKANRSDARFCSDKCRMKLKRTKPNTIVVENKTNMEGEQTLVVDKVIEKVKVTEDYYHSKKYLDLIKHLEETPIKELKKEGLFIPAWKYGGYKKKPDLMAILE